MTQGYLGGSEENPFIIPIVSAVWEKSIEVSKLDSSIFYRVNLISSHGERKMGGWFEGKRWECFRCRCTGGGKEVINGEVKELFIHKVFDALTQVAITQVIAT